MLYMSDDQFTKLFRYIEDFRKDVNKRFDEASSDRADIRGAVAELGAQSEIITTRCYFCPDK